MGEIESPKSKVVVVLTAEQFEKAAALRSERDLAYNNYRRSAQELTDLYQTIAGAGIDWELDVSGAYLLTQLWK